MKKKTKPPRVRRTAADAREAILEAAERRLSEVGPAGIRLQDVAADVGIAHPTILHHFGDREGLISAVAERAIASLEDELVASFTKGDAQAIDPQLLLERVSHVLSERGHARLLAWLLLSGYRPFASERSRENWRKIAEAAHAERTTALAGIASPPFEDTLFVLVLTSITLFGEALAGPSVFMSAGLDHDPEAPARYRAWLSSLVLRHLACADGTHQTSPA